MKHREELESERLEREVRKECAWVEAEGGGEGEVTGKTALAGGTLVAPRVAQARTTRGRCEAFFP
jgi:hypothetical protein